MDYYGYHQIVKSLPWVKIDNGVYRETERERERERKREKEGEREREIKRERGS